MPALAVAGLRKVVRDATGKEIEQSVPFFVSAKMLKAGLFDFSAEGGFARLNFAQQNFSYNRKPMASVSGRYGVVDWLTVDGHAEAMPGFGQAGLGVNVNTFGTSKVDDAKITECVRELFPVTPRGLINHLNLLRPIYLPTASYGHFGRELPDFTWEKTDLAPSVKSYLGI